MIRLPDLPRSHLSATDLVFWEALYIDGTTYREDTGGLYGAIDRRRLVSFRLVQGGETLVEAFPPEGRSGHDLVYRRRSIMSGISRKVTILVGYRGGPWLSLDADRGTFRQVPHLIAGDPEFDPPVAHPSEGEPRKLDDLTAVG